MFPERTPAIDHHGIVWLQLPRQLAPVPTELTTVAAASFDLHRDSEGRARLALCGRLDAAATASCWHRLERELAGPGLPALEIDASALEACDGSGIALLHHLQMGGMTPGAAVTVRGLKPEFQKLFEGFSAQDFEAGRRQEHVIRPVAEEVGIAAVQVARDTREEIAFLGRVAGAFAATLLHPRQLRGREVLRVFEQAGVNALPIVSLISLLVGLIIAFESAQPLAEFGAQIFIANMLALLMLRELAPLMTAILLAGRSSSAFAAELGTMKVNEELNALETMGLDPVRFLVVQRILAGTLLAPVLTLYSMFLGVLGGVIVMLALGFPLAAIYHQMVSSVTVRDVLLGTLKGAVFGLILSAIGCLRGLQTKQGPSAVGEATTRAVVTSILLIIIADALFALVIFAFDS